MSLYPTKTRLALLQAVADGAVAEHYPLLPAGPYSLLDRGPGEGPRWRKVTAAVDEQRRADWIRIGEQEYPGGQYKSPRRWEITALGREVLEAGGGEA